MELVSAGPTVPPAVLDPISRRWDERRIGNLTMIIYLSTVVSLRHVGVFVLGGMRHNYEMSLQDPCVCMI